MRSPAHAPTGHATEAPRLGSLPFNLLCMTVVCVLLAHTPHLPMWYIGALLGILLARWWQRRRHHRRVSGWLRLLMLVAVPSVVTVMYGSPIGGDPGAAIACGLLVLKLLESESSRDGRMLAGFACFILMSALLFDQSLAFTVVVILMLLPVLGTLRALEPGLRAPGWWRVFKPGAITLAVSVPAALLGFLLVPRLATPLWGAPNSGMARTGMTDRMAPGDLHTLLTDNAVAMRVGFVGPPPPRNDRYFRGIVLWDFDGRAWLPGRHAGQYRPREPLDVEGSTIRYNVTLLPSHRHWMFALDMPTASPEGTRMGPDRTLWSIEPINHAVSYQITSVTRYRLAPTSLDPRTRTRALQLPAGYDPRARALATRWRMQAGHDDAAIVRAALDLFHDGGFVYDLDAPPLGRNSVDDFLFNTRTGFCEHYAGSFTFLMRAAGIPARVVLGYQGGYWNDFAQYLLVRQSNAHSWTEVWLAGRGWVRVDPTAAVSQVNLADGGGGDGDIGLGSMGWQLPWRDRLDVVNRWWSQAMIGFDALKQAHLFQPLGINHAGARILGIALAVTIIASLGIGALFASLRRRRRPRDALAAAQWRLERRLARLGIVRARAEGPRDFYARATAALPAAAPMLQKMATEYLALRYAYPQPPPERTRTFVRWVRHFRSHRVFK